jgi:hypothetical protein
LWTKSDERALSAPRRKLVARAVVKVNYEDLREAFDVVSFGGGDEHLAYVSLDTGSIYWISQDSDEELPSDIETSDEKALKEWCESVGLQPAQPVR